MRKRDVSKLLKGDYIALKHNLGKGVVTQIRIAKTMKADPEGRYPMIQFRDDATGSVTWCTYLAIEFWPDSASVRR